MRLLTAGLQVRVLLAEPGSEDNPQGLFAMGYMSTSCILGQPTSIIQGSHPTDQRERAAMNEKLCSTFEKNGGAALIGTDVLACHPEPARTKLSALPESGLRNVYTIEKAGIKKLIFQSPWYEMESMPGLLRCRPRYRKLHFIGDSSTFPRKSFQCNDSSLIASGWSVPSVACRLASLCCIMRTPIHSPA